MNGPPPKAPTAGSVVPLLLAFVLAAAVLAVLSVLTLGFFGMIVAIVFGLAAFISLQYLLWGWWLGRVIREEVAAEEEAAAAERARQDSPTDTQ